MPLFEKSPRSELYQQHHRPLTHLSIPRKSNSTAIRSFWRSGFASLFFSLGSMARRKPKRKVEVIGKLWWRSSFLGEHSSG
jgi:hypothetical protein